MNVNIKDILGLLSTLILIITASVWLIGYGGIEAFITLFVALGSFASFITNIILRLYVYEGEGQHNGTCGEFMQGFMIKDQIPFHVTCPITKSCTIRCHIHKSFTPSITAPHGHAKIKKAAELALKKLGKRFSECVIEKWSDLDIAKGMASSTADIVATVKAIYSAFGKIPSEEIMIEIATKIESSDGIMVNGIAAFNHKNGSVFHRFSYFPKFNIVMIIPEAIFNTESVLFEGKEKDPECEKIYNRLLIAEKNKDDIEFARCATDSAKLNFKYLPNEYLHLVENDIKKKKGIMGICVGHTGTICGVLFAPNNEGQKNANSYLMSLKERLKACRIEMTRIK